jgi:glyoxylase-like metal-dependent hydrolase (beta-lactamase superfamily II)
VNRLNLIPRITLFVLVLLTVSCSKSDGPAVKADFPVTRITDHVYYIEGPREEPNKNNQGFMNNPAFVLTNKGVVVIDPGSSVQIGRFVLEKLKTITRDPVIAVFNTHIHGDHWLGNQAIRDAYPNAVIYAHPKMIAKAQGEGANWITLLDQLTEGATRGTQAVVPNLGLDNSDTLRISNLHFRIYHNGVAHTDNDLMIEVVEEKVLFLADNVTAQRMPRMDDGSFAGNIAAVDMALATGARHFVPGHGPAGGREVADNYKALLTTLTGAVKKYQAQGLQDYEMKDKVVADLTAFKNWALFDASIGKLVSLAYLQAESEAF